jgi:type 1 fimbria pilin
MTRYGSIFILMALGGPVAAADNMRFSGTLIEPPPCTINDGGEVDVDFGNRVGVTKVDGVNYLQPVNYWITCGPGAEGSMTLEVVGTPADYDEAAIASNVDNLAVRLLQNGKRFPLNKPLPIGLNARPTLEAVPVKRPGVVLKEGVFEATATLLAVYQ